MNTSQKAMRHKVTTGIFFFRVLREEIKCTCAGEGLLCISSKSSAVSAGCKAHGTQSWARRERDRDCAGRARPWSGSTGNRGRRPTQASQLHWDHHKPEAQEGLETPRTQGLTWILSCARSQPHTRTPCGICHGERVELLPPGAEGTPGPAVWPDPAGGSRSTQAAEGWKD